MFNMFLAGINTKIFRALTTNFILLGKGRYFGKELAQNFKLLYFFADQHMQV